MTIYVYTLKWCMAKSGWVLFVIKSILPWYISFEVNDLCLLLVPVIKSIFLFFVLLLRHNKISLNSTRQMHRSRQAYDWFSIEKLIYNVTEKNFKKPFIQCNFLYLFSIYVNQLNPFPSITKIWYVLLNTHFIKYYYTQVVVCVKLKPLCKPVCVIYATNKCNTI